MTIRDMTAWEVDQWSSHRLILDPLLARVHIRRTLELGAGIFSTEKLSKGSDELISLENGEGWIDEMKTITDRLTNHTIIFKDGIVIAPFIKDYPSLDLLFVDHSGDRREAVEEGMRLQIPYVVMHDFTEEDEDAIARATGYSLFSTRNLHFNPTALYTNNYFVSMMLHQSKTTNQSK